MYVRTVKARTQPGQVDELARRWAEFFGEVRRSGPPGPRPRAAYLAGDRAGNATLNVTTWDELPDDAMVAPLMREFGERVRDLVTGPPEVETYEVLAEL